MTDAAMSPKLGDRLTKLIPMLGSDQDGEVLATVRVIRASLRGEGLDLHDLARRLLNGSHESSLDIIIKEANEAAAKAWARDSKAGSDAADAWARDYFRAAEAEAERKAAERAAAEAERTAAEAERKAAERAAAEAERTAAEAARRRAERAAAAAAERAEVERRLSDRIAAEGPRWNDIGDAVRRAWIGKILADPMANLDPSTTEALNGIEEALAPAPTRAMRGGRRQKPRITWEMITPQWIAAFEKAARAHALRQRAA